MPGGCWGNYVLGVVRAFAEAGYAPERGLDLAVMDNNDYIRASTAGGAVINAAGDFAQRASADINTQLFTVAASLGDPKAKANIGGAINVISANQQAISQIGEKATINAGGRVDVTADTDEDLFLISVSAANTQGTVAVGGTSRIGFIRMASPFISYDAPKAHSASNVARMSLDKCDRFFTSVGLSANAAAMPTPKRQREKMMSPVVTPSSLKLAAPQR